MESKTVPGVKMKTSVRQHVKTLSSDVATSVAIIQHHPDQLSHALERNMYVMERRTVLRVKVRQ
jgi:hypothetical protein